jgi:chorismate mutase
MTDFTARAEALLREHRDAIDRLDAILVYTLAERFKQTQAVGRLKAEHDLPPSDPARCQKRPIWTPIWPRNS